jgi:CrcB protein
VQNRPVAHLLVVFAGGIVGGALRLALDGALPHRDDQFPLATLLINVVGSFALGLLASGLWSSRISSVMRAGLGAGLLGSFTTFSAVALAAVLLSASHPPNPALAIGYLVLTLVLGIGAAVLGVTLGRRSSSVRSETDLEADG